MLARAPASPTRMVLSLSATTSSITTLFVPDYNKPLDIFYGTLCCVCFLLGVPGNAAALTYFLHRKQDVSTLLYRIITVNDLLICVSVLPAGISFLSGRTPGILFGNNVMCNIWVYVWLLNLRLSVFLVLVLCCSRTYSLLKPFGERRCRTVLVIVAAYFLIELSVTIAFQSFRKGKTVFVKEMAICGVILARTAEKKGFTVILEIFNNVVGIGPIFVVFASSVISTVVLLRSESSGNSTIIALKLSRNKATVTILLFAAVYGVFNVPVVVSRILYHIDLFTNYKYQFHWFDYGREFYYYFENFTFTLSVALNSTINPILYLWRMNSFKRFIGGRLVRFLPRDTSSHLPTTS